MRTSGREQITTGLIGRSGSSGVCRVDVAAPFLHLRGITSSRLYCWCRKRRLLTLLRVPALRREVTPLALTVGQAE